MWRKVKISEIVANTKYPIGDGDHGAIKPSQYLEIGVPYIRVADIDWRRNISFDKMVYISEEVNDLNPKSHLFPGDIIIAKTGATLGKVAIIPDSIKIANTTSSIGKITLNTKIANPEFILIYMQSKEFQRQIWSVSQKSAQPGFNIINLKKFIVPLPSLDMQLHIASILNKAENLIAQRKESIRLLDVFLKSTFLEMFGDPSNNKRQFPKGTIRDVANEVKYGTSSPAENKGHYPYLRMNNITTDGYLDFSKLKYINVDEKDIEKYVVCRGDLLFNRTNSKELVGKTGVFNEETEMIIAGYLIRVRLNEKANPWYIWGYLNSVHGKKTLFGMCKSIVGMANINAQELQNIKILIPPIELQNQYAQIVEKTEALKARYQSSLQELENLYGSLSQRAFRGELMKTE